jgi:hypothetical protein
MTAQQQHAAAGPEVLVDRYVLESEIGEDTVSVRYDGGRVSGIVWSHFID